MSLANALAILGSGVAHGYRSGQELQRQVLEAKRKALLEERELAMREQLGRSQMALDSARIASEQAQGSKAQFDLGEAKRASLARQRALLPGGESLSIPMFGKNVPMGRTVEEIDPLSDIITQALREQGDTARANILGGSKNREPTDEEQYLKLLLDTMGPPSQLESLDPETLAKGLETRFEFLKKYAPKKIRALIDSMATGKPKLPRL